MPANTVGQTRELLHMAVLKEDSRPVGVPYRSVKPLAGQCLFGQLPGRRDRKMAHVPQIQVREPDVQTGKTSVQSEKISDAPGEVLFEGIAASANQQE